MTIQATKIPAQAIELALPLIEKLMGEGVTKRNHLHIVVAQVSDNAQGFTVLAEHSIGDQDDWENPYNAVALGKTKLTARTGLTARQVQTMQPELLFDDDVMYWGNALVGNIIVSCSGVQPWLDEAISNAIAWLCRALYQEHMEALRAKATDYTYS